jgi:hypothetical protein
VTDYFTHPAGFTDLIDLGQQGLVAQLPRNRIAALAIFLILFALAAKLVDLVVAVPGRLIGVVRTQIHKRQGGEEPGD